MLAFTLNIVKEVVMTPAVDYAKRAGISFQLHRYVHDVSCQHYGQEAADKLKVSASRVFKTLLVSLDDHNNALAVAVVPVNAQLDLKLMAKVLGVKRVKMADKQVAQRATGYLIGGISPLGQKRLWPTVIDQSACALEQIYFSGGQRGLEISMATDDLVNLTKAQISAIAMP